MNILTTNDIENYNLKGSNAINSLILFYMLFVSFLCHSHVIHMSLICNPFVTRMYSHVIRMWLVCDFTMNSNTLNSCNTLAKLLCNIVMYLYKDHPTSTSVAWTDELDKKSDKKSHRNEGVQLRKWCLSHKLFCVLFSVTQSFLFGFSWSSDNTRARNKKSTSKSLSGYLR